VAHIVSIVVNDSGGDDRRITYQITLEDNVGVQLTHMIGPIVADPGFDAAVDAQSKATELLAQEMTTEDEGAQERVWDEDSLYITQNPRWSTDRRIAKKLIRWMMREQDPRIVIALEPLIDYIRANYTAAQIAAWLDLTIAQVLKMNRRINAVLEDVGTIKAQIVVFEAESEDIE
jgi:hypothetical protein